MQAETRRGLWHAAAGAILGLVVAGAARWIGVWTDLNQPARLVAWELLQRTPSRSYIAWDQVPGKDRHLLVPRFDPHAAMLWLAVGFGPNGDFCAERGKPPDAFRQAFWRPLGLCEPRNSDQVPFMHVVTFGHSAEAREVARLMIAAGADVNRASSDGVVPLRSAVFGKDEEMVKLLLEAGADPLLKPKYSQIGDLRSALETAELLPRDPTADRIREMVRVAAQRRGSP